VVAHRLRQPLQQTLDGMVRNVTVTIGARGEKRVREAIRGFRADSSAEFLAVPAEEFAGEIERAGSIAGAVEAPPAASAS